MRTAEDSSAEQGGDLTPRIGNDYQAVIPPLREGTILSIEEAEDILPPCSVIEKYTFLLALYIFGKNLSLVTRFVGNKSMKEIQALYYGEFYASYEYRIWSEWGKWRGKRCIYGEKLFTECRLNEFMSRLLPCVSKRCQDVLMEVVTSPMLLFCTCTFAVLLDLNKFQYFVQISPKFLKGKISFEDYIFKLKDSVGVLLLIEVIGIGKEGKENLTSTAFEPMSSGKDWSSVTPAEILKFLASFQRLRKVRMNDRWKDFFWEAVWPRLLTRGWQCQQPKGRRMGGSLINTSLIFLEPSSSKTCTYRFSWRLVKGTHYHVSVKNMLKTVASDPSVLALGDEEAADPNLPKKEERRFLDPSGESSSRNGMIFNIVDTSTFNGTEQNEVTQLRRLPAQPASSSPPSDLLRTTKKDGTVSVDSSCRSENISDAEEFQCQSKMPNQREGLEIQVHPQNSSSTIYFEKGGPCSNVEGCGTRNVLHKEPSRGTGEARIIIDLSFTYVPPHVEADQPSMAITMQGMDNSSAYKSSTVAETRGQKVEEVEVAEAGATIEEQQLVAYNQRKSTRSRPLTKKAWEALENEFGSTRKKRRG
uniref:uncharacterized protein LOC105353485 n=1 Tax=Fragaria vesca subsp. vesca TaxID=101020 RepID=UPI0005C896DC|nr:PREDICTED: uncharacterized protein LOC105353485 [Fragaria vesca subsp. vesca]